MYWENILEMWFYECIYFWFPGNWTNTTSKSLENNTRWTSFATTNGRTDIIPSFQECGSFCCSKGSMKMYYCCVLLFLNYLCDIVFKIKLEKWYCDGSFTIIPINCLPMKSTYIKINDRLSVIVFFLLTPFPWTNLRAECICISLNNAEIFRPF